MIERFRDLVGEDGRDPLFARIRRNLTVWYTAILAVTLLLIGIVLYFGERSQLLGVIDAAQAQVVTGPIQSWQHNPQDPCRQDEAFVGHNTLWACYDPHGRLIAGDPLTLQVPGFASSSLIHDALQAGSAKDNFDTHEAFGIVRRYAYRVTSPVTGQPLGVFQTAVPVGDRISALNTLLALLVLCSILGLVAATAGGFFLANRSLQPARLAHIRQRNFIADASHELRTPLTMLRADAEVLLRDRQHLTPDQKEILQDVLLEATHMTSLANKLLDLARLDADTTRVEEEVVDMTGMVRELARRVAPLAAEREVRVEVASTEKIAVLGDALLLEHAALILIDNAIKYNRAGGTVHLSVVPEGPGVRLEVRDTGIGVASEHLPHLGERFYRVDKARSREMGGTGLGLSIVRAIVDRHHGTFLIDSQPQEGAVATIHLPHRLTHSNSVQTEEVRASAI